MSLLARRSSACALRLLRSRNRRATTELLSTMHSARCISPSLSYATTQQSTPVNSRRFLSTTPSSVEDNDDSGPWGDLFHASVGPELLGKTASIRRTFDARSNALGLLTCGGESLAKHASFDPEYDRARDWIQHHAVGYAVLSPVLISGLVGALVEAAVPQSVPMASSMRQIRPLIVGVCHCDYYDVLLLTFIACCLTKSRLFYHLLILGGSVCYD